MFRLLIVLAIAIQPLTGLGAALNRCAEIDARTSAASAVECCCAAASVCPMSGDSAEACGCAGEAPSPEPAPKPASARSLDIATLFVEGALAAILDWSAERPALRAVRPQPVAGQTNSERRARLSIWRT